MTPMAIETMPVDQLKPYAGNARTHSRKQIRQIAKSIERFGFTNPVLISDDNQIAPSSTAAIARSLRACATSSARFANCRTSLAV